MHAEAVRAEKLTKQLETKISADQIIQSHTPMQVLAEKYENELVMVVGSSQYREVVEGYGFKKIVTPQEYLSWYPDMYPLYSVEKTTPVIAEPVKAIMVVHDPIDWSLEIQLVSDLLAGVDPLSLSQLDDPRASWRSAVAARQPMPLYCSNHDFLYAGKNPVPRYAQNSFVIALNSVFSKLYKREVEATYFGKPEPSTYEFAEKLLNKQNDQTKYPLVFYGIGDNPESDIQGANRAGDHWASMLVRTGVFGGSDANSKEYEADLVFEHVLDAVNHIIDAHQDRLKDSKHDL
eukprot:Platyproteum_vivax@DN4068_c0_g1_i1.p1